MAISGGVDSLAMAHLLMEYNRRLEDPLRLIALHVRLNSVGRCEGLPPRFTAWFEESGIELAECEPRIEAKDHDELDCYSCARIRRRTLIEAAERHQARHVALGHHADDVVETWLMSVMFTGTAEALPPLRSYFDGAVTVVRPMYELQHRELLRMARLARLPEPYAGCDRDRRSKRGKIREVLAGLGRDQRLVRRQLYWAAVRQYRNENEGKVEA